MNTRMTTHETHVKMPKLGETNSKRSLITEHTRGINKQPPQKSTMHTALVPTSVKSKQRDVSQKLMVKGKVKDGSRPTNAKVRFKCHDISNMMRGQLRDNPREVNIRGGIATDETHLTVEANNQQVDL